MGGGINVQFILCSLYILIGMAVIAMCFNLMQQKVIEGVRNFGKKIGIIKEDSEENIPAAAGGGKGRWRFGAKLCGPLTTLNTISKKPFIIEIAKQISNVSIYRIIYNPSMWSYISIYFEIVKTLKLKLKACVPNFYVSRKKTDVLICVIFEVENK